MRLHACALYFYHSFNLIKSKEGAFGWQLNDPIHVTNLFFFYRKLSDALLTNHGYLQ